MEKYVLKKYQMDSRDDAVIFLKSLWNETPQPCPLCEGKLDFLHYQNIESIKRELTLKFMHSWLCV